MTLCLTRFQKSRGRKSRETDRRCTGILMQPWTAVCIRMDDERRACLSSAEAQQEGSSFLPSCRKVVLRTDKRLRETLIACHKCPIMRARRLVAMIWPDWLVLSRLSVLRAYIPSVWTEECVNTQIWGKKISSSGITKDGRGDFLFCRPRSFVIKTTDGEGILFSASKFYCNQGCKRRRIFFR